MLYLNRQIIKKLLRIKIQNVGKIGNTIVYLFLEWEAKMNFLIWKVTLMHHFNWCVILTTFQLLVLPEKHMSSLGLFWLTATFLLFGSFSYLNCLIEQHGQVMFLLYIWFMTYYPESFLLVVSSMEFLSRSSAGDGPLVAFGGSDGVIRVLSMITWKVVNGFLIYLWSIVSMV